MRRLLLVTFMLALTVFHVSAQSVSTPNIVHFAANPAQVDHAAVEASTAQVEISTAIIGMTADYHLQLAAWVNGDWRVVNENFPALSVESVTVVHPQDFDAPAFRLAVLDGQGKVVDSALLQLAYAAPSAAADIIRFEAGDNLSYDDVQSGQGRLPIRWTVQNMPANTVLVFQQIMPDGSLTSVELPREHLWIPATGEGVLAPVPVEAKQIIFRALLMDIASGFPLESEVHKDLIIPLVGVPAVEAGNAGGNPEPTIEPPAAAPTESVAASAPAAETIFGINGYAPLTTEPARSVETMPGETITLSWTGSSTPVYIQQVDNSGLREGQQFGPLDASGQLEVCPRDSYTYTLFAGGEPQAVAGQSITIIQSPSVTTQREQAGNAMCWNAGG
ncbi:MAG: hypothetical protein R3E39_27470 [Anaerolineae bacterium]